MAPSFDITRSPNRRRRRRLPKWLLLLSFAAFLNVFLVLLFSVHHFNDASSKSKQNANGGRRASEFFGVSPSRSSSYTDDDFSACLLVMDDSVYLQEFLAYHYHSVNLRRVIVAMDPHSQTSPKPVLDRWKNLMDVTLWWNESEYATAQEFQSTLQEVQQYFGPSVSSSPTLAYHKARQRVFYQQCLRRLKADGMGWTLLMDTDEFLTIHYNLTNQLSLSTMKPNQPGSVARFIQSYSHPSSATITTKDNPAWDNLQSSPCLQIPRIRYGAKESSSREKGKEHDPLIPKGWKATDFLTLRWRYHASPDNHPVNKITKAVLDLSQVSLETLHREPLTSIHLPVRSLCSQPRLHTSKRHSFLVIHHYLGSLEQYQYREMDARLETSTRSVSQFKKQSKAASMEADDDEIRPWFQGFVQQHHHEQTIHQTNAKTSTARVVDPTIVLQDVGKLPPKSWTTYLGDPNTERCALCFFGLPRSFASMVLPSIIKNILIPNARHNCDVFVHFYQQKEEPNGRKNRGGVLNTTQIYQLQEAVTDVQQTHGPSRTHDDRARTIRDPIVVFTSDTEESFWESRGALIDKYQTTKDAKGNPVYFPYKAKTYQKSSLENIVKQWHSIESAFKLLVHTESHYLRRDSGDSGGLKYTRVGMFRSDAMFVTPIDLAVWEGPGVTTTTKTDSHNRYGVQAGFAQMPVNDRLFYGPRAAVEVWATRRFEAVEDRARLQPEPGYTMHSERFLNSSIFPLIEEAGYPIVSNPDLCCLRVRADESVMLNDCSMGEVTTRGWGNDNDDDDQANTIPLVNKQAVIQEIVGRTCRRFQMGKGPRWIFLGCGGPVGPAK